MNAIQNLWCHLNYALTHIDTGHGLPARNESRCVGTQVRLKMAARMLPQLPAIYQRGNSSGRDIAKELGVSVPDWAHVRRNRAVGSAHRRLMAEPIIEKV